MKAFRSVFAVLIFLSGLVAASPAAAQSQPPAQPQASRGSLTVPITGNVDGTAFTAGTFKIERFVSAPNATVPGVYAVGLLTFKDAGGVTRIAKNVGMIVQPSSAAAAGIQQQQVQQTCEILDLVLGPLDLDLLGLQIHLDQVVLNITAVGGAGNLLGNLLCGIVGLLDGLAPTVFDQLARLLNQLLGILG